jgi:hypothetical protein
MSRRAHSSSFESSRTATTDQRFAATAGPTATSPRETSEDSGDEVPTTTYHLEDLRRAVRTADREHPPVHRDGWSCSTRAFASTSSGP